MEFIELLTRGVVQMLPLLLALIACVSGYFMVRRGRRELVDSPWLWAFAFSTVGLLGVWAISNKYDDRQKRLEARYDARQRIAEQGRRDGDRAATAEDERDAMVQSDSAQTEANSDQLGYPSDRRVPLRFLATGLVVVSLLSAIMLWRTAARRPTGSALSEKDDAPRNETGGS